MTADAQDWTGLGFNPAPGAAHVVDNLVTNMAKLARHLHEVHDVMEHIKSGRDDTWTGEAANAFKKSVGELPGYLRDASEGAAKARKALYGWHQTLLENQPKARNLEAQAKDARKRYAKAETDERVAQANPDLKLAGKQVAGEAALADAKRRYKAANDQLDEAVSKLNAAHSELDDLIKRAHSLEDDHESVAHAKERAIREAADSTADPDWNDFKDWWSEHGGDVLGVVAGVLGVAAFFCPVLAIVAIGVSLLAMGAHTYQYAKEGTLWPPQKHVGNWITLGGDALGVIPGAKVIGSGLTAGYRASGGIGAMVSGAEGAGRVASIQQGFRGGVQGFGEGAGAAFQAIRNEAGDAPPIVKGIVDNWARRNNIADDAVVAATERQVAIGTGSLLTATQVPSLGSDSDFASNLNTAGGGYANMVGGLGGGPAGTAVGIASALGLGAVSSGSAE